MASSQGESVSSLETLRVVQAGIGPQLRVRLFGTMEAVTATGDLVLPRIRRTKAILAMLVLAAPHPLLRDQFTSLLWSQREKEQARASLRQCVFELQDVVARWGGTLVRTGRDQIALDCPGLWVDAIEVMHATPRTPGVLDLVRGPLLQDLSGLDRAFERWLDGERQRLLGIARALAEAVLAEQTDPVSTIDAADALLRIDPTHEGGWRAVIAAHAERGEQALAIAAYERCARALADLAQVAPAAETEALIARIRGERRPVLAIPAGRDGPGAKDVRVGIAPLRALDAPSEDFAEGLEDEITSALSRFRGLCCVVLRRMTREPLERGVWESLGLAYVLEGSVQRGDDKIRVVMRLLAARTGETVWQHRFLRPMTDLLTLQDEIAGQTAARIDPALLLGGMQRASLSGVADPAAYPLLLRAIPAIYRLDREEFSAAGRLLEEAVPREPGYAPAHAWLAHWHMLSLGQGWTEDRAETLRRMRAHADRALALDPGDARSLTIVGHVRAFTRRGLTEARALHERALSINPNLPLAWVLSGLAEIYRSDHEEGIRRIERARALSPLDPAEFWFDTAVGLAHLLRHEHEAAISAARRAADVNPYFSSAFKVLASALGHAGMSAADALARLAQLEPGFTVTDALARTPIVHEEDRDWFAQGLRRAGVPE